MAAAVASVHAFPSYLTSRQDGGDDDGGDDNQGVMIVVPPVSNDTGLKAIPGSYIQSDAFIILCSLTPITHA